LSKKFDETALEIAKVLDDKKAEDIVLIDVSDATILAETFVIASGGSPLQVRMLADEVAQAMGKKGIEKRRVEGYREGRWVVVDFGYILVHVFHREERAFYDIERLWKNDENAMEYMAVVSK
jgi:ribosome-associated protein